MTNIRHHLGEATLMSYAAGSLGEALSAVAACHISLCPRCAAEVRAMETCGAALFEQLPSVTVSSAKPTTMERASVLPSRAGGDDEAVFAPLRRLIGPSLDKVAWRWLGFGVWHSPLALSPAAKGDLRLVKVAPGWAMPEHGHGGSELTLVLAGSYRDELGEFRTGDISDLDEDTEHRPIADEKSGCVCVIASEGKTQLKGLIARLVQPLAGF